MGGALILDGMGTLSGDLRELSGIDFDAMIEEVEKQNAAHEAFRLEIMHNPTRNPQWALYKAIEDGTAEDLKRALDAGACPNKMENGQASAGGALAHLIYEEVFSVEKAKLLVEAGSALAFNEGFPLMWQAMRCGQFSEHHEDRVDEFFDGDAVNLAAYLYTQGAPVDPAHFEQEEFAEFMSLVEEQVLADSTVHASAQAMARRL
ncbi:hypothetical protein N799_05210 [Lysobacter arseniciresistens ZS79]|uniref:Ankyrin n=2 Tax=Novilysobacter TaxID=3382699 RepID=A0A0A0F2V7_9GAMM|nr:hypothetical protein N799_05210 [Lysobacter arseniciresistens ZS79]